MKKYIITQEYFDQYPELAEAGFEVDDIVIINEDGCLEKTPLARGSEDKPDPNLPPSQYPPVLP